MDSYIYLTKSRITKGNIPVKEEDLNTLGDATLKKALKSKIIKLKKPLKNGSSKQSDSEGPSD